MLRNDSSSGSHENREEQMKPEGTVSKCKQGQSISSGRKKGRKKKEGNKNLIIKKNSKKEVPIPFTIRRALRLKRQKELSAEPLFPKDTDLLSIKYSQYEKIMAYLKVKVSQQWANVQKYNRISQNFELLSHKLLGQGCVQLKKRIFELLSYAQEAIRLEEARKLGDRQKSERIEHINREFDKKYQDIVQIMSKKKSRYLENEGTRYIQQRQINYWKGKHYKIQEKYAKYLKYGKLSTRYCFMADEDVFPEIQKLIELVDFSSPSLKFQSKHLAKLLEQAAEGQCKQQEQKEQTCQMQAQQSWRAANQLERTDPTTPRKSQTIFQAEQQNIKIEGSQSPLIFPQQSTARNSDNEKIVYSHPQKVRVGTSTHERNYHSNVEDKKRARMLLKKEKPPPLPWASESQQDSKNDKEQQTILYSYLKEKKEFSQSSEEQGEQKAAEVDSRKIVDKKCRQNWYLTYKGIKYYHNQTEAATFLLVERRRKFYLDRNTKKWLGVQKPKPEWLLRKQLQQKEARKYLRAMQDLIFIHAVMRGMLKFNTKMLTRVIQSTREEIDPGSQVRGDSKMEMAQNSQVAGMQQELYASMVKVQEDAVVYKTSFDGQSVKKEEQGQ